MHISSIPLSPELRNILEDAYTHSRSTQVLAIQDEFPKAWPEHIARKGFLGADQLSDLELVQELNGESYETTDLITVSEELTPGNQEADRTPDDAAIFYVAAALRALGEKHEDIAKVYDGQDHFVRQCMRVAREFEEWCCSHVDFAAMDAEVWPYRMEDRVPDEVLVLCGGIDNLQNAVASTWPLLASRIALKLRQ